jgi:outer membrane protein
MNINRCCACLANLASHTRVLPVVLVVIFLAALGGTSAAHAQIEPLTNRLVGDVGGTIYATQSFVRSHANDTTVLPYLFADYGRFFTRVDTFGVKTLALGYGYLELAGRASFEGWRANTPALIGLSDRRTPVPLGLSTFQQTPYGVFIANAFVDANKSRGSLFEASYVAEFKLGQASIFPQVGFEHRSAKYSNYLYGVTTAESIASGYTVYTAGASTTPILGLGMDLPLGESQWFINLELTRKWLSSSIYNSPLVTRKTQDFGLVALSYRFN